MMRYWPEPSVVAVLTFSISAGLDASTVTPGSTAPDASLTTPVMDACAKAAAGTSTSNNAATNAARTVDMRIRSFFVQYRDLPNLVIAANCRRCEGGFLTKLRQI